MRNRGNSKHSKTLGFLTLIVLCSSCQQRSQEGIISQSYVHRYGVEVTEDTWNKEGQEGRIVITLATGVVRSEGYRDGVLDGETTFTFPHSAVIEKTVIYSQGVVLAEVTNYPSGVPLRKEEFLDDNRTQVTIWYENGLPQAKEKYIQGELVEAEYYTLKQQPEAQVSNGQGIRIKRDGFGQLISQDKIQDGACVSCTTYHPNGTPKDVTPLSDNVTHGEKRTYSPAGEPVTVEKWKNGTQEGTTTVYKNGVKWAEVPYANGSKNGMESRYREDGQLAEEISWKNGQMTGPYYSYAGGTQQTAWYYKDKLVSRATYERMMRAPD